MKVLSSAAVASTLLTFALLLVPPTANAASCRSCAFLSTLDDDDNEEECDNKDCHRHTGPCLDPMYVYPLAGGVGGNYDPELYSIGGGALYLSFLEAQAYASFNPTITPEFASCIPSYAKVIGTCSTYQVLFAQSVYGCNLEQTEFPIRNPWTLECKYTIETAKGNLNLQGSMPSADQCFLFLYKTALSMPANGNQVIFDYAKGLDFDRDDLVGKCCADVAITGGTGAYCSAKGSVRMCQLLPPSLRTQSGLETLLYNGCRAKRIVNDYGVSMNFDGLTGCEKKTCCEGPKASCE